MQRIAVHRSGRDPPSPNAAGHRGVVAIALPGFGDGVPLPGEASIATLRDAPRELVRLVLDRTG